MTCVEIVQFLVGFNQNYSGPTAPDRELRQEDPISPYHCGEG